MRRRLRIVLSSFAPGHEPQDWLAAEAEIDTELTIGVLDN